MIPPLLAALLLAAPGAASAAPRNSHPPRVEIGRVALSAPTRSGGGALLVPVRYPIAFSGRVVPLHVRLTRPGGGVVRSWLLHDRVGAQRLRAPERRRRFTFVHRVDLEPALARRARRGLVVRVGAGGALDVDRDGVPELRSGDRTRPAAPLLRPRNKRLCSSVPRIHIRHGRRVSIPLPACAAAVRWRIAERPGAGRARIHGGRLLYRAPRRFRGATALVLRGRPRGGGAIAAASGPAGTGPAAGSGTEVPAPVQIVVDPAEDVVVRAIGDSVTAGFGHYSDGTTMPFGALAECRPAEPPYDDACSSNSEVRSNTAKSVEYASDYGLANNVSWAAQWANGHGVTNYANYAISGSEPKEWAPGGILHERTAQIESEDPDYILITIGANPLLSEVLFGLDNIGCAVYSDLFGGFAECVERAFERVGLRENLRRLYTDLVEHTRATVFLMQYPLTVPAVALAYTATQIAEMAGLLNREIARVAAEVDPGRLRVVAPPHFNVGIDIAPAYPSEYSCSRLGFRVDGPSVQSEPAQKELRFFHPFSFCPGPVPPGPPWVISGDTGIHPSAAGYAQMAARVPAPE